MASNHLQQLDKRLLECFKHDIDWDLVPPRLKEMCTLFAKGLKQQPTSILFGMLVLVSFCMGHASVEVHEFWTEPVIIWLATVLNTGRCKSAFHGFITDILEDVAAEVESRGQEPHPMVLPHCTWDKFGDLLANSGGRLLGMFDELMSFFSTMNMYSSTKMQVSDTKEYQDFLQMYTGKCKTRETITGNANFHMQRTSFTMMGFTQPHTAMPVIEDKANNAKGFTSRLLWYFPEPMYSKLRDSILTKEEQQSSQHFKNQLVNLLATLYIDGESTYNIVDNGKMKKVSVDRSLFKLSEQAIDRFEIIHDEWEMDVCKKYPHDVLIGGLYSRGKSHILRLAVPIHVLLSTIQTPDTSEDDHHEAETSSNQTISTLPSQSQMLYSPSQSDTNEKYSEDLGTQPTIPSQFSQSELECDGTNGYSNTLECEAIDLAHSIVKTCLSQLCELTDKKFILHEELDKENENQSDQPPVPQPQGIFKVYRSVLMSPGKTISLSLLNAKGLFRRHKNFGLTNKQLFVKVVDDMDSLNIGAVQSFQIPSNKTQVYFFIKQEIPNGNLETIEFSKKLARLGVTLKAYSDAYYAQDDESEKHEEDYHKIAQGIASPMKKQRID